MRHASRPLYPVAIGLAMLLWVTVPAVSAQTWTQGRTPDGQPDIQGTWLNFDNTPFEAPIGSAATSGGRAARARAWRLPANSPIHNHKVSERRRSMVVDPPDGRVPVMKWAEDKRDYDLAHIPDAPEHETPWVRCITRGHPAGMFPASYNNAYQIIQIPGYVVIAFEMIHETQIIPIDGRPRLGAGIRHWNGEPRGRWEGNTLVVESHQLQQQGLDRDERGHWPDARHPADRRDARGRAVHARRRRYHQLLGDDRRSEGVHEAVDGGATPQSRRQLPVLRVLLPRRELRAAERAQLRRSTGPRSSSGQSGEVISGTRTAGQMAIRRPQRFSAFSSGLRRSLSAMLAYPKEKLMLKKKRSALVVAADPPVDRTRWVARLVSAGVVALVLPFVATDTATQAPEPRPQPAPDRPRRIS